MLGRGAMRYRVALPTGDSPGDGLTNGMEEARHTLLLLTAGRLPSVFSLSDLAVNDRRSTVSAPTLRNLT
jgi:hypothetical protein